MEIRKRRLNTELIVAFTAILISVCALVVSFYEVRIMRTQQKASVWPFVTMGEQYNSKGFALLAANKGIGPAKVESLKVWVKGKQVKELDDIFTELIGPDHGITYNDYGVHGINGSVLEAGYEKPLFNLNWTEATREVQKKLFLINVEVIYSSILGDCWKLSLKEENQSCDCPKPEEEGQFYF